MIEKKYTEEEILDKLRVNLDVLSIFPYGSRVYGNASEFSDHDYVIVAKSSMLPDGSFKQNARSSADYLLQGTLYSRGGFQNDIDNYMMPAMECMSLDEDDIIKKSSFFKIRKWSEKDMVKSVIKQASGSRHIADKQCKSDNRDRAQRGMFHAIRILHFGLQLKEHHKIVDFSECNKLHDRMVRELEPEDFDSRDWYDMFNKVKKELES